MQLKQAYFINLEKDIERLQLMEARLSAALPDTPYQRFSAISAEQLGQYENYLGDRLSPGLKPVDGRYPRPGLAASCVSHYLVLKAIVMGQGSGDEDSAYLVLEDDCVFDETVFPAIGRITTQHLPGDWTAVKHSLGRRARTDLANEAFYEVSRAKSRTWKYYWGAHFVIYRGSAVAHIVHKLETCPIYSHDIWLRNNIDHVYSFARRLHIKQSNLGGSNTNASFAGPEHEDRNHKFGVTSLIPKIYRRLRRDSYRVLRRLVGGKDTGYSG